MDSQLRMLTIKSGRMCYGCCRWGDNIFQARAYAQSNLNMEISNFDAHYESKLHPTPFACNTKYRCMFDLASDDLLSYRKIVTDADSETVGWLSFGVAL